MATQRLPVLVGRNVGAAIVGLAEDPAGILTKNGTAVSLQAKIRQVTIAFDAEIEDVKTMDMVGANAVVLGDYDWTVDLVENKRRAGATAAAVTGVNPLEEIAAGSSYVYLVICSRVRVYGFVGAMSRYGYDWPRGSATGPFQIRRIDLGWDGTGAPIANPAITPGALETSTPMANALSVCNAFT
jgi:hypothetical protein